MSSPPLNKAGRKRTWLKRIAIAVGLLVALLATFLSLVAYELTKPVETKLGGHWILSERRALMGEPGLLPTHLQRVHGRERVTVAELPSSPVYIGEDCVLFALLVKDHYEIKAGCGDRQPVTVAYVDKFVWQRDLAPDPARINGKEITWKEIRQHAQRGESLTQP